MTVRSGVKTRPHRRDLEGLVNRKNKDTRKPARKPVARAAAQPVVEKAPRMAAKVATATRGRKPLLSPQMARVIRVHDVRDNPRGNGGRTEASAKRHAHSYRTGLKHGGQSGAKRKGLRSPSTGRQSLELS